MFFKKKIFNFIIINCLVLLILFSFIGCKKSSDFPPSGGITTTDNGKVNMPDQSYSGYWDDKDLYDQLTISEINNDYIKFNLSVYRLASIDATATIENNSIKFVGLDPAGNNIYGTLVFSNNTIYVSIDQQNWQYELPKNFTFTRPLVN